MSVCKKNSDDPTLKYFFVRYVCTYGRKRSSSESDATRWRNSQAPSRLDCLFTNEEFLVDNLSIQAPLGKSDHAVIAFSFVIKTKLRYPNNNLRWNFKRLNVPAPHDYLQQVVWDVHPQLDVDGH
ncbi:unnamed protein product [Schistosoma intercalatum]|nr:unnamed protein product [Schistosoma intercalatum]